MNDTDSDPLEAGPALDALVAEQVMGWRLSKDGHAWKDATSGTMAYRDDGPWLDAGDLPWNPSDNLDDAWEVIEKLEGMGIYLFRLGRDGAGSSWRADFDHLPTSSRAEAATAPLALCLAALKCVGA